MAKYTTLKNTSSNSLKDFSNQFTKNTLKEIVGTTILDRGVSYLSNIIDIEQTEFNKVEALVRGNYGNYEVRIKLKEGKIRVKCECMNFADGYICKHIVAVALTIKDKQETLFTIIEDNTKSEKIELSEEHLNQLSKEELITIILKNSNQNKKTTTENLIISTINDEEEEKKINIAIKNINNLFNDEILLNQPEIFKRKLDKYLNSVVVIYYNQIKNWASYFLAIIENIENASQEGYLYDYGYGYGEESSFDASSLSNYMYQYIKKLSMEDKMEWLKAFYDLINSFEFDNVSFDSLTDMFENDDLMKVKAYYLQQNNDDNYYNYLCFFTLLKDVFTKEEKITFLDKTHKENVTLMEYYQELLDDDDASLMKVNQAYFLKQTFFNETETIFKKHIELLKKYQKDEDVEKLLTHTFKVNFINGKNILYFIQEFPDNQKEIESVLEKRFTSEYFIYLSNEGRIDECLSIIKDKKPFYNPNDAYFEFFVKYSPIIRDEAITFFTDLIDKHLPEVNNSSYTIIAESLKAIKSIDIDLMVNLVKDIRHFQKRKRNLMKLLDNL